MTTFRLARSPTATIAGAVRALGQITSIGAPVVGGFPSWLQFYTQIDEQLMYDNVLNWTWTAADKTTEFAATPPATLAHGNVHNETEADDLWQHYVQYKRTKDSNPTAAAIHLAWAQKWRDYFVLTNAYTNNMNSTCTTYGDHLYGQGLVLWGVEQDDAAARQRAMDLLASMEATALAQVPGTFVPSQASGASRRWARALIIACYVSMMDSATRWITLRNHLIDLWMGSPNYVHESYGFGAATIIGGMHPEARPSAASGSGLTSHWGNDEYDSGFRWLHSMYHGMQFEAHWLAYKLTGRTDVRDRIVHMARYILHYAWDPLHANPMAGARWGHRPVSGAGSDPYAGTRNTAGFLHGYSSEYNAGVVQDPPPAMNTNPDQSPTDNYESALIGGLIYAYKITGEQPFLDRAFQHLRQATCYANATGTNTKTPQDEVRKYLDTERSSDPIYFDFNKGMLQYSYAICENGGVPAVESAWPPYAVPQNDGEVVQIAGQVANLSTVLNDISLGGGSAYPTNVFADVRPSEVGSAKASNGMLTGDSVCAILPSYSRGGAIGNAGSGGHHATINFGGCLFDFEDARWKRVWTGGTTNSGPPPAQGGPPYVDFRTGTRIHNCLNFDPDLMESYRTTGSDHTCFNSTKWNPTSTQLSQVPRTADPRDQTWDISRMEADVATLASGSIHAWQFPGEWNGDCKQQWPGRFTRTGYVAPAVGGRFNPTPAGTLAPTQSELPGVAHVWNMYFEMTPAEGGGPKGSIICGRHTYMGDHGETNLWVSHRFDLDTGIWHQWSVNSSQAPVHPYSTIPYYAEGGTAGAYDPVRERYFIIGQRQLSKSPTNYLLYANKSDRTWRIAAIGGPSGGSLSNIPDPRTEGLEVDPDRRLLLMTLGSTTGNTHTRFRAFDLSTLTPDAAIGDIPLTGTGGFRALSVTNAPSVSAHNYPWMYYPPNGNFYRLDPRLGLPWPYPTAAEYYAATSTGASFRMCTKMGRLTPPPIDAAAAAATPGYYFGLPWTYDEITIDPVPRGSYFQWSAEAAGQQWFKYVPSLQRFAYLPINSLSVDFAAGGVTSRCGVFLIKPY